MPITNELRRERYKNDSEYKKGILDKNKRWRENNKQHCKDYEIKRYDEKSKKYAEYFSNYRKDHKQEVREYNAKYRKENRERIRMQRHKYYLKNRDIILKKRKEYQIKNGHQYYLTQKANGCNTSEATRKHNRKNMAKRKRDLGSDEICENVFEGSVDWHHITDDDVIAVPRWIHNMHKHPDKFVHREQMFPLVCQLYPELEYEVK